MKITKPTGVEKRAFNLRAESQGDEMSLVGRAASFNVLSQDLGGFREMLAPGCFSLSLATNPDVKCLINHDASLLLGRTKSGTLKVWEDAQGLNFKCQLDPNQQAHRDFHSAIKRGDIDQCSFAFTVPDGGDDWAEVTENGARFIKRTVRAVNLMDVSAVTYPAYNADGATAVSARELALHASLKEANDYWLQITKRRVAIVGQLIAEDKRAALTPADLSSMEDYVSARLDEALKIYGYRLADVDTQNGYAYGCNHDFDPDDVEGHDPDDCDCAARFNYQIKPDGSVDLDNQNISAGHDKVWALKRSANMPTRFFSLLTELRQRKADRELRQRMRNAAGINTR